MSYESVEFWESCNPVHNLTKDVRLQKMEDPVMAHVKLSDALYPSLTDRFFEGDLRNWRFASEDSNYLFKPSSSIPGNAVNADKTGASYEDGILHITLPKRESIKPKPAKEINILCIYFLFYLSLTDIKF